MRSLWKIAVLVACVAATVGSAVAWRTHRAKVIAAAKFAKDLQLYRIGAAQGNADDEANLGDLYYFGRGVPQSYAEALHLFRQSADQGNARGKVGVGYIYYDGNGVPQDYVAALAWFRSAADQGNPWAQNQLGVMYASGKGTSIDYVEALNWYRKAADQGNVQAEIDLGSMYYYGKGVQQGYTEAARWYRKAADQGGARAEYDLGYMYHYGKGVPRSFWDARRWYRRAAAQGDERALRTISCGLTTTAKISLLIQVVAGLFFTLGCVPFRLNYFAFEAPRERLTLSQKLTAAAGTLFLLCAAYGWYGYSHFKFRQVIYGSNSWVAGRWLFEAAAVALLFSSLRLDRKRETEEAKDDISEVNAASGGSTNV